MPGLGLRVTAEAKSEHGAEGMLGMDHVRQTDTRLTSLAADRGLEAPPESSTSVIVTPHSVVDPGTVPIAAAHVHPATPKLVLDIAHDTVRAWKEPRGPAKAVPGEALTADVARVLRERRPAPGT